MARPFREGSGWAFRLRTQGQDIYRSGFPTQAAAQRDQDEIGAELKLQDQAVGQGPFNTTLAAAFTSYARERLPHLKGALADSRIINRYLRALNLPVIRLTAIDDPLHQSSTYWTVEFVAETKRIVPNSLKHHRTVQETRAQEVDEARRKLAATMMADVRTHAVQALVNARRAAGYKTATIALERAELRRLFNHAKNKWHWTRPVNNPAIHLDMPAADKPRDSVLSNAQWVNMSLALCQAGNDYAPVLFCLMLETAMRSCEPLILIHWRHIDWKQNTLKLVDAKNGARDVPLSPGAIAILKALQVKAQEKKGAAWSKDDKIFPTTYEAVKKSWSVAREICNRGDTPIGDLRIHDLRHTAATRYALVFNGNLPVIMLITGHTTPEMAMRYINIKANTVAHMLHGSEPHVDDSPAGYRACTVEALTRAQQASTSTGLISLVGQASPITPPLPPTTNVVPLHRIRSAA